MTEKGQEEQASVQILVVDDEEPIRRLIARGISDVGFGYRTAESAEDALDVLASGPVDVVITDIKMPGMSGLELTRIIRETYDTDVMVMTGHFRGLKYEDILAIGASDFIEKPLGFEEMIARLNRILRERAVKLKATRAQEMLRKSEEKYRGLVENTEDAIYLLDRQIRYVFVNQTYLSRFDLPIEEVVGRHYGEFHTTSAVAELEEEVRKVIETGKSRRYEHRSAKDGKCFIRTLSPVVEPDMSISGMTVVSKDVTEEKQVERELIDSRERLRNHSAYLEAAREEERTSVSREIHDDLGQLFTALKMDTRWLEKRILKNQGPLKDKVHGMIQLLDQGMESVQRISAALRPGMLDDLGLCPAMEWQLREFATRLGVAHSVTFDPKEIQLADDLATTLFRIFQEALTNIARHADATRVEVSLIDKNRCLALNVTDNGRGITKEQASGNNAFGLIGMRERAQVWGGSVALDGEPGKGTRVTVSIPR